MAGILDDLFVISTILPEEFILVKVTLSICYELKRVVNAFEDLIRNIFEGFSEVRY